MNPWEKLETLKKEYQTLQRVELMFHPDSFFKSQEIAAAITILTKEVTTTPSQIDSSK